LYVCVLDSFRGMGAFYFEINTTLPTRILHTKIINNVDQNRPEHSKERTNFEVRGRRRGKDIFKLAHCKSMPCLIRFPVTIF